MNTQLFELCLLPFLILFVFIKNMKHLAPFSFFANIATLGGLLFICKLSCHNLVTRDKHWHHIWWLTCSLMTCEELWQVIWQLTCSLMTCEELWQVIWQLTCSHNMSYVTQHVKNIDKSSDSSFALLWHLLCDMWQALENHLTSYLLSLDTSNKT